MLTWLSANLATILISAVLLAVVISIIRYLIRQKKQGKSTCGGSCGGGCAGCSGHCHSKQERKKRDRTRFPRPVSFSVKSAAWPPGSYEMQQSCPQKTDSSVHFYIHDMNSSKISL